MATASEILSAIASTFDDAPGRQSALTQAESRTSATFFGTNRPAAVAYRAAHTLALSSSTGLWAGGASGPITSKSEGTSSVSFGRTQGAGDSSYLSQTSYGCMLLDLMRSSGPATGITGIPYVVTE